MYRMLTLVIFITLLFPMAILAQSGTESEKDVVIMRIARGRQASHELIYAAVLTTVPNTESFSFTDNLVSVSLEFTEEGEYLVFFRSFLIEENEDYSSIWDGLEVDRPTGS